MAAFKIDRENKKIFEHSVDMDYLKTMAAIFFKMSKKDIEGPIRGGKAKEVRHILMNILFYNSDLSLKQIGIGFSNRDHASVIHGREATNNRVKYEPVFKKEFDEFIEFLNLEKAKELV